MKIWATKTLVQLLNHSSGLSNGLIIRISMVSAISWMMQVLECCSTTKQNCSCHPMEGECFQPFHDATWNFMIADSNHFFIVNVCSIASYCLYLLAFVSILLFFVLISVRRKKFFSSKSSFVCTENVFYSQYRTIRRIKWRSEEYDNCGLSQWSGEKNGFAIVLQALHDGPVGGFGTCTRSESSFYPNRTFALLFP